VECGVIVNQVKIERMERMERIERIERMEKSCLK
jgi:hypothetical protein